MSEPQAEFAPLSGADLTQLPYPLHQRPGVDLARFEGKVYSLLHAPFRQVTRSYYHCFSRVGLRLILVTHCHEYLLIGSLMLLATRRLIGASYSFRISLDGRSCKCRCCFWTRTACRFATPSGCSPPSPTFCAAGRCSGRTCGVTGRKGLCSTSEHLRQSLIVASFEASVGTGAAFLSTSLGISWLALVMTPFFRMARGMVLALFNRGIDAKTFPP